MVLNEDVLKTGWVVSEKKPGYLAKTLQHGNCTITINRPILTPEEQKKREEEVSWGLAMALRDYVFRKEREAQNQV